ncbi:TIP41-like protein [Gossypium australe]|uniref:TIP41-like protein n=1 Tax=Gossypium australe TaxID=47621 RepID=A0A5B6X340_9ROSI|nr:TIP41-like protein [Gossypium australe]
MGTKTPNFATLPEMIFGESCLVLFASGNDICFNALDAFSGWKHEGLPPVEVPSPAQWKFRSKPFQQVILEYDCGSDMVELDSDKVTQGKKFQRGAQASIGRIAHCGLMSLRSHEKNQFFSVVLYEDELADNKVSLLTVKVCYLDCGTPASIVFLMGVHILPFFEKDVGRKAHINLYLLFSSFTLENHFFPF